MMLIVVCCVVLAAVGGCLVGIIVGTLAERERAARRNPAPHEPLARVYEMPTPKAILTELSGPLSGRRPIPEARGDWWGV